MPGLNTSILAPCFEFSAGLDKPLTHPCGHLGVILFMNIAQVALKQPSLI